MANGVILDTNCFSRVFNQKDMNHPQFASFLEWLCDGPGFLVYGGSRYFSELKKAEKYLRVFSILHRYNKARVYNKEQIDNEADRVSRMIEHQDFDDPHLAAIVIVSRSEVICTTDARCFPFLKRKDIYDGKAKCPKFYTGERCNNLLSSRYVGDRCSIKKEESIKLHEGIKSSVS